MYWNNFEGGHESTAVTAPNKTWLFAEGVTGGDASFAWDTYLLLANPQNTDANVTLTFFRQDGTPLTYQTTVPANKRRHDPGRHARHQQRRHAGSAERVVLDEDREHSKTIIAERAMYWSSNGITYIEGHNTPGVNAEALKWAFAEGAEGSIDETRHPLHQLLPGLERERGSALNIKATFVREDGTGIVKTFTVPAQSRFTIPTGSYPELSHQRFAAFLESTNNLPFVAERAVYWGDGFYGGTASVGTPWDAAIGDAAGCCC